MNSDGRFGLIIGGLSLVLTALSVVIGLLWRVASGTGRALERIKTSDRRYRELADALDRHLRWHLTAGQRKRE